MANDRIGINEYWYLMNRIAYWLVHNNKKFNTRSIYNHFDRVADYGTIVRVLKERGTNYERDTLMAEFVECAIVDNSKDLSFLPAYVTGSDGTKYYTDTFVSMANRVSAWEVTYGESPNFVYIKPQNTTSKTTDSTLQAFISYFGNVTCIDDCLEKIKGRGYAYYFNSNYNTANTLKRIYNRQGVNCTDSAQVFYRLALALGYECQFVHVRCASGTGHVRLRLRKNGGSWFYRDPAAVLDGNSITHNWCSNGRIIAYNPSWIFSDLYQ